MTGVLLAGADAAPAAAQTPGPTIQTVPPVPGMRFALERHRVSRRLPQDERAPAFRRAGASLRALDHRDQAPACAPASTAGTPAAGSPRSTLEHRVGDPLRRPRRRTASTRARSASVTLAGQQRPPLRAARAPEPRWLPGNRVDAREPGGTRSTRRLLRGRARCSSAARTVVHRGQQRFFPAPKSGRCSCGCCCSRPASTVRDALLGFPIGSAVLLEYPERRERRAGARPERRADPEVAAAGRLPGERRRARHLLVAPIALSRDQEVRAAGDQLARHRDRAAGPRVARPRAAVHPPPAAGRRRPPSDRLAGAGRRRDRCRHGPAARGGAPRPAVRLLLHLVQRELVESGQDRLPAARSLLERRPRRDASSTSSGRSRRASTASS